MYSVSAVIPTYNGTVYLAEAVQSALAQTYELLEIIVVDDGSKEDIKKILEPFYPKVRYVRQENAGPAAARNLGISIAKGDLIAFLDDDDVWQPTKTAEQVKLLNENPKCALVYSYPELIDEQGKVIPNEAPSAFPCGNVYLEFLKKNRINTPSATLIRREIFTDIGLFDDNKEYICSEDYDLWLRIARKYEFEYCPGFLVSYRVRSSGISRNLDDALKGKRYAFNKWINHHNIDPILTDKDFNEALDFNLHNTFRNFAYSYYFSLGDRTTARHLMFEALKKGPYSFKDMMYLVIFSLPDSLFRILKKTRQMVSEWKFSSLESILWTVLISAFLIAYFPVFSGLIRAWSHSDDYSHGFAIVPIAVYILWQKRRTLLNTPLHGTWPGLVVAGMALLAYLVAIKAEMQTLGSFSMILFLWGTVIYLFGYSLFKESIFPLCILFFMVPVPSQIVATLTIPLQLIVTKSSVWLASTIGIPIFNEGNVINMTQCTFEVVQACSGLRSIMTLLTLGAVLAYLTLRSNLLRTLLFLLATPIAIAVNILRVFVLIAVFHYFKINLSAGTLHTILGLVIFAIAVVFFLIARKGLSLCER